MPSGVAGWLGSVGGACQPAGPPAAHRHRPIKSQPRWNGPPRGNPSASRPLQGGQAVAALKQQGSYEGLRQAWQAARYQVEAPALPGAGPYRAWNPAQRIYAEFDAEQVQVRRQDHHLALRLTGYGYGERLSKPEAAQVVAQGNRVEYRRGALVEWYVNGPQGLE